MTITDEAVEAGARALWDMDRESWQREYDDCRPGTKRHLQREARAVLEAAAPHMRTAREKRFDVPTEPDDGLLESVLGNDSPK
jgi:hypothetical protein